MKHPSATRPIRRRPVVVSLAAMVMAALLSVFISSAVMGTSLRMDINPANVEEREADTPTSVLDATAQSVADIQFREQNWVFGVGEPNEAPLPVSLSRNELEYMQHNWDFTGGTPLMETPVRGSSTAGSPEIGFSSGMINRFAPETSGPGEGLNDFRFIEENVQLPSAQTWRGGPGEGLNDYRRDEFSVMEQYPLAQATHGELNSRLGEGLNDFRFIEENTLLPGPNGSAASIGHPADKGLSRDGGY